MLRRNYIHILAGPTQSGHCRSFCGGWPLLPRSYELPLCKLCGAKQTFFFQCELEVVPGWERRSIAVFHCTECVDKDALIPPMLEGALRGADVPEAFLQSYERNFEVMTFRGDARLELRREWPLRVAFREWRLDSVPQAGNAGSFVGGAPEWLQDDEAPGRYAGEGEFDFLAQLQEGLEFPIGDSAPRQVTLGLDAKPKRSARNSYRLFLANQVYFFGASLRGDPKGVYVITQRS